MSRNGSGVYSLPAGSLVTNGDSGDASQHNTPLQDLETDMNTARPVVAGGTGATSAADARTNLEVPKAVYEYHDPTGVASYRVIGDTLECWGAYNSTATGYSLTFPKTFDNAYPRVTLTANASGGRVICTYQSLTATGFFGQGWDITDSSQTAVATSYHAIGKWDGVS